MSNYPRCFHKKTILIYDRLALLRNTRDPQAQLYQVGDDLTRLEIQLKGKGVPFPRLSQLSHYADLDLLHDVRFTEFRMSDDLSALKRLAAERLLFMIQEFGLQATSKRYSSGLWLRLKKLLLANVREEPSLDLGVVLKKSTRDWLENRLRYPR